MLMIAYLLYSLKTLSYLMAEQHVLSLKSHTISSVSKHAFAVIEVNYC